MAWTIPKTNFASETLTATQMNAIGQNLIELKTPPQGGIEINDAVDYTTTSTSFVDIDTTDFRQTITTNGGDVLVTALLSMIGSTTFNVYFDVEVDGVRQAGDDGAVMYQLTSTGRQGFVFRYWVKGLSAAAHTFDLQWKVTSGTATIEAGQGGGGTSVHGQFDVREVS